MVKFVFKKKYTEAKQKKYSDFIQENSELSQDEIEFVVQSGGAWIKPAKKRLKRLRGSNYRLKSGDAVEFYYDSEINFSAPVGVKELHSFDGFSIWFKPAGVRFQGNKYGDRGTFLSQAKKGQIEPIVIHHIDRNTEGLVLVAYKNDVANQLLEMWNEGEICLSYRATVLGHTASFGVIEGPLDGEYALTTYTLVEKNTDTSVVEIEIDTDIHHQIRRHFELIGHPIMGDHKYGVGNKHIDGLQLQSFSIAIGDTVYTK